MALAVIIEDSCPILNAVEESQYDAGMLCEVCAGFPDECLCLRQGAGY